MNIDHKVAYPKWGDDIDVAQLKNNILSQFPVCCIAAFIGGYFIDAANTGFTNVLGNTIANVNAYLSTVDLTGTTLFKVCDGTAPNDPNSPIYNTASKHLPNLTDDRFLCGSTVCGQILDLNGLSGSNDFKDHQHIFNLYASYAMSSISTAHSHLVTSISASSYSHRHSFRPYSSDMDSSCNIVDGSAPIVGNATFYSRGDGTNHTIRLGANLISGGPTTINLSHTHASQIVPGSVNLADLLPASLDNRPNFLKCFYVIRIK